MSHKKKSKGSGKYTSEHRYEKNKVRKIETYVRKHPNDLERIKQLQELKEQYKSIL
jgi:Zn-dependent protease with chaperone function